MREVSMKCAGPSKIARTVSRALRTRSGVSASAPLVSPPVPKQMFATLRPVRPSLLSLSMIASFESGGQGRAWIDQLGGNEVVPERCRDVDVPPGQGRTQLVDRFGAGQD